MRDLCGCNKANLLHNTKETEKYADLVKKN